MRPVLVCIDMQEDYLARDPLSRRRGALEKRIAALLDAFRRGGLPVIHVKTVYKADRSNWTLSMKRDDWPVVIENTPGAAIVEGLSPKRGEPVVIKSRYSPFFRTDFAERLQICGADTLVVAGVNTHACVRSTVIDAFVRDWPVIVPPDCVDSWDPEHHRVSLEYLSRGIARLTPSAELIAALPKSQLA